MQIKSHAQKVLKRVDAGENVFQRLEDNRERLKVLVDEANRRIEAEEAKSMQNSKKKRKRTSTRKPPSPVAVSPFPSAWDLIHGLTQQRRSDDTPAIPSSPSSGSAGDPPGVHASQQDDSMLGASLTKTTTLDTGSGAVIAAVAALCQLSARTDP